MWIVSKYVYTTYISARLLFISESQFNYLFTLKNAHLSSNSCNFRMQPNIPMKFAGYVAWTLICKGCKFGEKICYHSKDIEFFLGDYFLARPVYTYFDPKRNEKILPSLFLGLIARSARSFMLVGKNGSEPTIGNDSRAGGNLWPLLLTFSRRYNK